MTLLSSTFIVNLMHGDVNETLLNYENNANNLNGPKIGCFFM